MDNRRRKLSGGFVEILFAFFVRVVYNVNKWLIQV